MAVPMRVTYKMTDNKEKASQQNKTDLQTIIKYRCSLHYLL